MAATTFADLPSELLGQILTKLRTEDRLSLSCVNRALWREGRQPAVWADFQARYHLRDGPKIQSFARFLQTIGRGVRSLLYSGSFSGDEACEPPLKGIAQVLRLLPALQELRWGAWGFGELGPGVLATCATALTSFHLRMEGETEYLCMMASEVSLAWLVEGLVRLPALQAVHLGWAEASWAWLHFWEDVTALCGATTLTSLCLLNSDTTRAAGDPQDPATWDEGQWGLQLSQLASLAQYEENLGIVLPRELAQLTRLTSLTLHSFTWARQGEGLCAARHLSRLALGNLFPPEEDSAGEVSHSLLLRALRSVTHLQWAVKLWEGTGQPAYCLSNLVTLETRGPGEQLCLCATWLPMCRLRALRLLDPVTSCLCDLEPVSLLTTLTYLHVRNGRYEVDFRVRLPRGPWLAHVRVVRLQGVSLIRIPLALCEATCLEVLDLRGNEGLALRKGEVSRLLALKQLRHLWLCKDFSTYVWASGQCCSVLSDDDVFAYGDYGEGLCRWDKPTQQQLRRLRAQAASAWPSGKKSGELWGLWGGLPVLRRI